MSILLLAAAQGQVAPPLISTPHEVAPKSIVVLLPAPPAPGEAQHTRPTTILARLVSDFDYPREALRNLDQGVVNFRLTITPDGKVLATKPASSGTKPVWNAALSAGWGSTPAPGWEPYSR